MNRKADGFTLTEIIVTMIIIMALAALAIVKYGGTMEKFRAEEGAQVLRAVMGAAMRYKADHGQCPADDISKLDVTLRTTSYFNNLHINVTGTGYQCLPNITIDRVGSTAYQLKLDAATQQITCTGTCPKL